MRVLLRDTLGPSFYAGYQIKWAMITDQITTIRTVFFIVLQSKITIKHCNTYVKDSSSCVCWLEITEVKRYVLWILHSKQKYIQHLISTYLHIIPYLSSLLFDRLDRLWPWWNDLCHAIHHEEVSPISRATMVVGDTDDRQPTGTNAGRWWWNESHDIYEITTVMISTGQ